MAVCNLFNKFKNASGNFLLFSQYVEDVTKNFVEGDNWKVVPSKFVALNIDYSKINKRRVQPNNENMNDAIPRYFQNCFENACAYGRENYSKWVATVGLSKNKKWNPEISRNLFWNCMFDGELLHTSKYGNTKKVSEVVYYSDIAMHSYNEHQGMGYGEIYCYVPASAGKMNCQVVEITDTDPSGRKFEKPPVKTTLEGHTDKYINNYIQEYYYNQDFRFSFDDPDVQPLMNSSDPYYTINTVVVLYDVLKKINDDWIPVYANIPMGIYFTGLFDDHKLLNEATKYNNAYNSGTSYGLRICTRFNASSNHIENVLLKETEVIVDDTSYTNMCQLMIKMNENLSKMLDISKSSMNTIQEYKETLSMIKNNRTNVPYVKDVNGLDYWFVNGRAVSAVNSGVDNCCTYLSPDTIRKRIDNIMDEYPCNDYTYIDDPNGCNCEAMTAREVAKRIWPDDPEKWDEFPNGVGNGCCTDSECKCDCDHDIASDEDIADILNRFNLLKVLPETAFIEIDESIELEAMYKSLYGELNVSEDCIWKSNDESIATVNAYGKVTGVSTGYTKIICEYTLRGTTYINSCSINVGMEINETHEIKITPESLSVEVSETAQLKAEYFTYLNGVQTSVVDVTDSCTWSTRNNNNVISVTNGFVRGINKGNAIIEASYKDAVDKCEVTVIKNDKISVNPTSHTFAYTEGSIDVNLTSNGVFTVNDIPNWVKLSKRSGSNNAVITISVLKNVAESERSCNLQFICGEATAVFSIIQESKPIGIDEISLNPNSLTFEAAGGRQTVEVIASDAWEFIPDSNKWIDAEIIDESHIEIAIPENTSFAPKTGILKFVCGSATAELNITQKGATEKPDETESIKLNTNKLSFDSAANSYTVIVTSSNKWTCNTDYPSWIELSKTSGTSGNSVIISVYENTSSDDRSAVITFACGEATTSLTIIQTGTIIEEPDNPDDPTDDYIILDPEELIFPAEGGTKTVKVTASDEWTFDSGYGWVTAKKIDNNTLEVTATPNTEYEDQHGSMPIYCNDVTKHLQITKIGLEPDQPEDSISIDPTELSFTAEGGTKTVEVTASGEYSYINEYPNWLTISNADNTVTITVAENETEEIIFGKITFTCGEANTTLTVVQDAASIDEPEESYTISVDPEELSFIADGGTEYVDVTTNGTYAISENIDWITIDSLENIVGVTASKNETEEDRNGVITFTCNEDTSKTATVIIKQSGMETTEYSISIDPNSLEFEAVGGNETVTVTSSDAWTASADSNWISLSASSGNNGETTTIIVAENETEEDRSDIVTFTCGDKSVDLTITQKAAIIEEPDSISINPISLTFDAGSETKTVRITANNNWTATASDKWIILNKESGTAEDLEINVTSAVNLVTTDRTGTVTFTCGTANAELIVVQKAAATEEPEQPPFISLSEDSLNYNSYLPAVASIGVACLADEGFTATKNSDWIGFEDGSNGSYDPNTGIYSGNDGDTVKITISENLTWLERVGTVTFKCGNATATLTITQAGKRELDGISVNPSSITAASTDVGTTREIAIEASFNDGQFTEDVTNSPYTSVTIGDETIASYSNGVITLLNAGQTALTISYTENDVTVSTTVIVQIGEITYRLNVGSTPGLNTSGTTEVSVGDTLTIQSVRMQMLIDGKLPTSGTGGIIGGLGTDVTDTCKIVWDIEQIGNVSADEKTFNAMLPGEGSVTFSYSNSSEGITVPPTTYSITVVNN